MYLDCLFCFICHLYLSAYNAKACTSFKAGPNRKSNGVFEKRKNYNLFHFSTYDFLKDYIEDKNPEDRFGRTALHIAAREGHLTVCKILLEVAKNKSPKDNNGRVPLHMAAREGHLPVCQLLLDAAEDKNPKDDKDVTPYSLALENGHQEVARFISEMVKYRGATANLSQARPNIPHPNFLTCCLL